MTPEGIMEKEKKYIMQSYRRLPILIDYGRGSYVYCKGNKYLDFTGALGTSLLGHGNKELVAAIKNQALKIINSSNLYYTPPQVLLAEKLSKLSGLSKCFFSNSGSEAIDTAIKLARKKTGKKGIIATHNAFHGRTFGALSATWKPEYKAYCSPLLPGFSHIPYNDLEALEKAIDINTAAFIVEPIQGESGIIIPDKGYLKNVLEICNDKGALLILDEVQTGMGRTGKFFAYEHEKIKPDIVALSKGLANGLPIGVTIAGEGIDFEKGNQGSTSGGNSLCCVAALKTIEIIERKKLMENATAQGDYIIRNINGSHGKGLMIGIKTENSQEKTLSALDKGLLINKCTENVLRMLPPMMIAKKECDYSIKIMGEIL